MVLAIIALFGTRKVLAGIGVALTIGAIVCTVLAQNAVVHQLDQIGRRSAGRADLRHGERLRRCADHGHHARQVGDLPCLAKFREGGRDALAARPVPGRPPKLSGAQIAQLYELIVGADPAQFSFEFALWTREMVRQVIRRDFQVALSVVSVGRLLCTMGLSPQRPLYRAYQQNPEARCRPARFSLNMLSTVIAWNAVTKRFQQALGQVPVTQVEDPHLRIQHRGRTGHGRAGPCREGPRCVAAAIGALWSCRPASSTPSGPAARASSSRSRER